ncbi:uncharacterized protein BCR38DRAFT_489435 [Pseudomassariella vexata]|uniref:Uncharacterized protein n=1 Tax=Pseudomassariella vexata TaxID=1141098 RepID=A0A1Y2DGY2_9PEZI|nr:uncharacterized protein BCR38DRAFT_489435 [Pseudomassariella vexata]ORY58521.1 hypothetical protein BCR38DRAFT_489435 [Pseudomassariella vexata]
MESTTSYPNRLLRDPDGPARILAYICTASSPRPNPSDRDIELTQEQPITDCLKPTQTEDLPRYYRPYSNCLFPHITIIDTLYLNTSASFPAPLSTLITSISGAVFRRHNITVSAPDMRLNLRDGETSTTAFGEMATMRRWMAPVSDVREEEFRAILRGFTAVGGVGEVLVVLPVSERRMERGG